MIIDGFGIAHPTENDPITTDNLLHIAKCSKCKDTYDGQVSSYAEAVSQAWDRAIAALGRQGSDGNR